MTLVVIAFGLLGMAGLQMRLQMSELESYQRGQALLLLNDMASRIATNRTAATAGAYAVAATAPLGGPGVTCPGGTSTQVQRDLKEWCEQLQGAGEVLGSNNAGAMVGGRGCIENVGGDIMVTVAWQGLTPISAPPASVGCGAGLYDGAAGSPCVDDLCRRTVTTLVRIATLL